MGTFLAGSFWQLYGWHGVIGTGVVLTGISLVKKTNTTADANSVILDDMYCMGTYQGSEKMSNYLVFCDEWPQDADVRETLLSFKIPEGM